LSTTTSQDRIDVVRRMYGAINDHDLDTIESLLSDDCVRHYCVGSTTVLDGEIVGRDAVVASYRYMIDHTGGDHEVVVGNVLANSALAASYHQEVAGRQRDGARLDAQMFVRWRVENGRIVELWDYANDVPGLNAFLA
jgi:ketosteroid isomerase-like protein